MHKIYELKDLVEREIGNIVDKGGVKPEEWKNLGEAVDIYKDIVTIESMLEFGEPDDYSREYSGYRRPYSRNSYRNGYDGDMIDSRGSRTGARMNSYENSRDGGNTEETIRMLEHKLNMTQDPAKRDSLAKTIEMLKYER